ncbi:hypothetical protein GCM10009808_26480 [Microbacterium sediminicola]|uniref:LTD domain-containing protein n=1 Tax=Microbacterium sediminicola TaxID=415210 RepID=A0ABN2IL42_9MICO
MRRRLAAALAAVLGLSLVAAVPVSATAADEVAPQDAIVINEASSQGIPEDWVELYNTSDAAVDVSGWMVSDSAGELEALPEGSVVDAGGYLVLVKDTAFTFGLGKGDEFHLYLADGATLVDEVVWPDGTHADPSWGRCVDGTGEFTMNETATPGAANDCPAPAGPENIVINEVTSQGDPDWVEIYNDGTTDVDISGWVVTDSAAEPAVLPEGTIVPAEGYLVLEKDAAFPFGLGKGDEFHLYLADGVTLVDEVAWPADTHADPSYGRCPDGTGEFAINATATPGAANDCVLPAGAESLVINEVSSDPADWVEIYNAGATDVDISGWHVDDDSDRDDVLPTGSIVPAGGYLVLEKDVDFTFGLGKGDKFRLFLADGVTPVDEAAWPADTHADPSWGRCPTGTGDFAINEAATPGAANECPSAAGPDSIVINEVTSQGDPDWVELYNSASAAVDISGWVVTDSAAEPAVLPEGTVVPAEGYLVLEKDAAFPFGLGKGDEFHLYLADGVTLVDEVVWPADTHADPSFGRCLNGVGAFVLNESATPGTANDCPPPAGWEGVVINEIESSGGDPGDWIELYNTGESAVDLSGWILRDNADDHELAIEAGTILDPGAFLAVFTDAPVDYFGLGNPDQARLFLPDGVTLVDSYGWEDHASATTYGRCPDGTGEFVLTYSSTAGSANDCSPVRINEVESSGDAVSDWIELVNIGDEPVDVSGYVLSDDNDEHVLALADGTTIAAGAYLAVDTDVEGGFGLGGSDSARLFAADGATLIDSYTWTEHAATTWARCPDGSGDFALSEAPTKGAANECVGVVAVISWLGGEDVALASAQNQFGADLSGLAYEATGEGRGTLWAVQNGDGLLYKLEWNGTAWVPVAGDWADGKTLTYPDGTGTVDAEGIGLVDGSSSTGVYVSSERNNDASSVSRPSVLLYDVSAAGTTLAASMEWNLASLLPTLPANGGLEGVTWIPDSALVAEGFIDESTTALYDPATYADHGQGLFFVGVEGTARIYAVALMGDGSAALVATIDPKLAVVADVFYDATTDLLWAVCDDACAGQTAVLQIAQEGPFVGTFQVTAAFENPAGMADNIANEGFTIASALCADGFAPVFYADDSETAGYSIREGSVICATEDGGSDGGTDDGGTDDGGTDDSGSDDGLTPTGGSAPSESALTPGTQNQIQAPSQANPGETITITVGAAYAGQTVNGWVFSTPTSLGTAVVSASGTVTFTLPASLAAGTHRVVVTDSTGAVIGWQYIQVDALADTGGTAESSGIGILPFAAVALLLGAALVATRRRLTAA